MAEQQALQSLVDKLGVDLDSELVVLAMTHRSFAHEAGGLPTNERLEFLGDSVLGLVVTAELYRAHPGVPEGSLAKMRAATVSQRALADVARELELGSYVLLGKGETATGGADKDSILSDTLEALIATVYLCHGIEVAREVVLRLVGPTMRRASELGAGLDWKTSLQELAAELGLAVPHYVSKGQGPDHARHFTSEVTLDGLVLGEGEGSAKKHAEQQAAQQAFEHLRERSGSPAGPDA